KLARDNPQFAFVTPDGTCYQGRMVTGGRPDQAGPLGMKRELRALDAEGLQLEHQMNEKQTSLEKVAAELRATEQALEGINTKLRDTEREVISAQHRHGNMQTELARLGAELAVCQNELARVRKAPGWQRSSLGCAVRCKPSNRTWPRAARDWRPLTNGWLRPKPSRRACVRSARRWSAAKQHCSSR